MLIITTVTTLTLSFVAFLAVIKMRRKGAKQRRASSMNSKSAEDLLELIVSARLNEVLITGDTIEITVSTNGHPIASREYSAIDWNGQIKLESTKEIRG